MNIQNERHGRFLFFAAGLLVLAACTHQSSPATNAMAIDNSQTAALAGAAAASDLPKVPFGHQPCKSLSQDEQKALEQQAWGYAEPVPGKPDRAPAGLPFDNVCFYSSFNVGYMAQTDYQTNRDANHSAEHPDPPDLPGAFYDKQGGLWFAKDGYYVNIEGGSRLREPLARALAAKL